jgi:hypothetical protein
MLFAKIIDEILHFVSVPPNTLKKNLKGFYIIRKIGYWYEN